MLYRTAAYCTLMHDVPAAPPWWWYRSSRAWPTSWWTGFPKPLNPKPLNPQTAPTQVQPGLADVLVDKTKLLRWLLARLRRKDFDSNKQYASEVLAVLVQVWGSWGGGCAAACVAGWGGGDRCLAVTSSMPSEAVLAVSSHRAGVARRLGWMRGQAVPEILNPKPLTPPTPRATWPTRPGWARPTASTCCSCAWRSTRARWDAVHGAQEGGKRGAGPSGSGEGVVAWGQGGGGCFATSAV